MALIYGLLAILDSRRFSSVKVILWTDLCTMGESKMVGVVEVYRLAGIVLSFRESNRRRENRRYEYYRPPPATVPPPAVHRQSSVSRPPRDREITPPSHLLSIDGEEGAGGLWHTAAGLTGSRQPLLREGYTGGASLIVVRGAIESHLVFLLFSYIGDE